MRGMYANAEVTCFCQCEVCSQCQCMYALREGDLVIVKKEEKMREGDGDDNDNEVVCNANGSHEVRINARKMCNA